MSFDVQFVQMDYALEADFGVLAGTFGQEYSGAYIVVPANQTQVLPTAGLAMTQDVRVAPIPNNYGLITYNGFGIMVS